MVELSKTAMEILKKRYLKKDEDGNVIESPDDMFSRVADFVASTEKTQVEKEFYTDCFFHIMSSLKFLPNSPTLMNAGRKNGQLSACFVLPVTDTMEGIFDAIKNTAIIHKTGGGTGFSFSSLRPKNSRVGSTGGVASGPVSFMKIFNTATEQVKQGGTRRGANMGVLRVDHPDILEFISCKDIEGEFNNFNISVGITEEFMQAVNSDSHYNLYDPRNGKAVKKVKAYLIFDKIVRSAWAKGDPGVLFLDTINKRNQLKQLGNIEATNPCGEVCLLPYESCNLGSINLKEMVIDNALSEIELIETTKTAIRFLDNIIDVTRHPLPEIEKIVTGNRKIGLGVMGFADMLYKLNIPYGSEKSFKIAEKVMRIISDIADETSIKLAEEKGVFPNFDKSEFKTKRRNATLTSIAPTGTLSMIAGCSSGIEPNFGIMYKKTVMDNDTFYVTNSVFNQYLVDNNITLSKEEKEKIADTGSIQEIDVISDEFKKIFVVSQDLHYKSHVYMQAAFQKYVDNSVSKTINFPNSATKDDISEAYKLAYETECKGITIYRDGCRQEQVINFDKPKEKTIENKTAKERPETITGKTNRMKTGYGNLYVTVNEIEGKPFEVFATIGKSGRSTTAKAEAIGRLVSLALRHDVPVEEIVKQLKGIGGEYPVFQEGGLVLSIPDGISRVLEANYVRKNGHVRTPTMTGCPDCGNKLEYASGCVHCISCGYSKCG